MVEIKITLKKGVECQIGNIKFKALDAIESETALEIPIEVIEADGTRGGSAMVKLYAPSAKKEN